MENVQWRDEKYWLPGQPEEAYVCIRVNRKCLEYVVSACAIYELLTTLRAFGMWVKLRWETSG